MEWQNFGITEFRTCWKQYTPLNLCFAVGIMTCFQRRLRSAFAVRMKKLRVLGYPFSTQRRLWSDLVDVQADLSFHWVHMTFCLFCAAAQMTVLFWPAWLQSRGHEFEPQHSQISFREIVHEIISLAILSLLLIQVGQLPVTGKSMCT